MSADTDVIQDCETETAVAFEIGKRQVVPPGLLIPNSAVPVAILPEGLEVVNLESFLDAPVRTRRRIECHDPDSLGRYVKDRAEHGLDSVLLTASIGQRCFVATLDAYRSGGEPGWGEHVATLNCPLSEDWKRWAALNGKPTEQSAFADFLEDMAHTILTPDAARVQEMVLRLEGTTTVSFRQATNLQNGLVQYKYEENGAESSFKLPAEIVIEVRPFEFAPPVKLIAKLRYRIAGGKLTFHVVLVRPDIALKDAFATVVKAVETQTGIAPYLVA